MKIPCLFILKKKKEINISTDKKKKTNTNKNTNCLFFSAALVSVMG
jgi:hypothetical protein